MRRRGKRRLARVASGPAMTAGLPLAFAWLEAPSPSPSTPPSAGRGQLTAPAEAPPHVVRDRVPQGDGFHFLQPAHQQAVKPSIPRLRVDALHRARPPLVDLLRLVRLHPLAPLGYLL